MTAAIARVESRAPMRFPTSPLARLAVAFAFALPALLAAPAPSDARSPDELAVGTELQAVADVALHRASIAKGSKVAVTKIAVDRGNVANVDLELADGHVVPHVGIRTVRAFFRVVDE
jgi:hypothetical protein